MDFAAKQALKQADRETQTRFALEAVLANPHHAAILDHAHALGLPEPMLFAGSVYKAVWNRLTGRAPDYGVNDYDLAYFDPADLEGVQETRIAAQIAETFAVQDIEVEACNQARVHIWFNREFGTQRAPLTSSAEAVEHFASLTHAVGLYRRSPGEYALHAPFGLKELIALETRPVDGLAGSDAWNRKCTEQANLWPEVCFLLAPPK